MNDLLEIRGDAMDEWECDYGHRFQADRMVPCPKCGIPYVYDLNDPRDEEPSYYTEGYESAADRYERVSDEKRRLG